MEKITRWITRFLSVFLTILMVVIVLDVTWQVITRFVLKNPSSYTEELAGFLLIWIGILGASYALHTKSHLGIDVLTERLQHRWRPITEIIVHGIVFFFALFVLVVGGVRLVRLTLTLDQVAPALGIRIGYVYLVLPISGVLMMVYSLDFILLVLRPTKGEDIRKTVRGLD